jgi:hypothetical protein
LNCERRLVFTLAVSRKSAASNSREGTNATPGDVEAIAADPGQDGIGPAINPCYRLARVHGALGDRHPGTEFFWKIGPCPPRRETGHFGSDMRSKGEHVHEHPIIWSALRSAERRYKAGYLTTDLPDGQPLYCEHDRLPAKAEAPPAAEGKADARDRDTADRDGLVRTGSLVSADGGGSGVEPEPR